jgi:hypothetical protein
MSFILLEIAMQAVASANGIGPDLSEASENQSEGSPEMSDRRGDGFQMQGSKSETGLRARSESIRAMQRLVVRGCAG